MRSQKDFVAGDKQQGTGGDFQFAEDNRMGLSMPSGDIAGRDDGAQHVGAGAVIARVALANVKQLDRPQSAWCDGL